MSEIKVSQPSSMKIAMVISQFNKRVAERLYDGAMRTLVDSGIDKEAISIARVPGAFEIPLAVKAFLERREYAAIIALGVIIRGRTAHFEYIANECTHGIAQLSLEYGTPVGFGVLTVENLEQAMARTKPDKTNKGSEAARVALEMISVLAKIRS